MDDVAAYGSMIGFKSRMSAYARALEAHVVAGSVVLDIGAGTGILSFLACRAGASKVYAVESEDIVQLARETAADNGLSSRIEFIQGLSTEIELPEKVDGIRRAAPQACGGVRSSAQPGLPCRPQTA